VHSIVIIHHQHTHIFIPSCSGSHCKNQILFQLDCISSYIAYTYPHMSICILQRLNRDITCISSCISYTYPYMFIYILQRLSQDITRNSSYISYTFPHTDLAATQWRYYLYFIIYLIYVSIYRSCSDSVKILRVFHHISHIRIHIQILQRLSEDITCISSYISYTYSCTHLAATQWRYNNRSTVEIVDVQVEIRKRQFASQFTI